ncbi:monocarboxylate transporter 12-like [Saccoglossus kowalevskii]
MEKKAQLTNLDGGYAWVILVTSYMVFLICGGNFFTSGVFLVSFLEYFHQGAAKASIIGSLSSAFLVGSGLLVNYLCKRFGARIVVIGGGFLSTLGVILSIFAPSLSFLYFSFGVLVGLGYGLSQLSVCFIIGHYFKKRYALASGIMFAGASCGILCLPPLYNFLIEIYGWRGSLFFVAGMNAQLVVCGALLRPFNRQSSTESVKDNADIWTKQNSVQSYVCEVKSDYKLCTTAEEKQTFIPMIVTEEKKNNNVDDKNVFSRAARNFFHLLGIEMFIEIPAFTMLCVAQILEGIGFVTAIMYLAARAISVGISKNNAAFMLTLMGVGSSIGRVTHGWIVDRGHICAITLMGIAVGCSGVILLCISFTTGYPALVTLTVCYGFFFGIYQPLVLVSLRVCVGDEKHSTAFSWDWMCMAIGYMCGPPFAGWLYDKSGSYNSSFYAAAGVLMSSGIIVLLASRFRKCSANYNARHDV